MTNLNLLKYDYKNKEELEQLCSSFYCTNTVIDNFIRSSECLNPSICKTYLLTKEENNKIELIGFFSLAADAVLENTTIYNGGAIRILMFAVDERYQKQTILIGHNKRTYASLQLVLCLETIQNIVEQSVGASYIVLSSTKEGYNLYTHVGEFETIDDDFQLTYHEGDGQECIDMYKPLFDLEEY